jgi:hypothetical protein
MQPIAEFIEKFSPKQKEFIRDFISRRYLYLFYGGAMGGGKTILMAGLLDRLCLDFPGTRYVVLRKNLPTIKRTVIPSFNKVRRIIHGMNPDGSETSGWNPNSLGKLNRSDWTYTYKNGSQLIFMEADITKDQEMNKLKGLEVTGGFIDEANEVDESVFDILKTRVGRWMNIEYDIRPFILLASNPDTNWVKDVFYDPWARSTLPEDYYYLPALPKDNPFLGKEYLKSLETLGEAEYNRYVLGNWDYASDTNQLCKMEYLSGCYVTTPYNGHTPIYVGIDFAREGDDSTIICYFDNNKLLWFEKYKHEHPEDTVEILHVRKLDYGLHDYNIWCDAIGNGATLIDLCRTMKKMHISAFKSSECATEGLEMYSFRNLRAQTNWFLKEDLRLKKLTLNHCVEFQKQALQIRYKYKEKHIIIEEKAEIKKRLHYSPDYWEAACIGNHARRINFDDSDINTIGKDSVEIRSKEIIRVTAPELLAKRLGSSLAAYKYLIGG